MDSGVISSVYRRLWWGLMLRGLFAVALGAVILWRPLDSIASFALVIAIWALFSGFVEILHAVELRRVFSKWWVGLIGGLISVGFGAAAFYFYPQLSLAFAVIWAAWWFFFTGAAAVMVAATQRRLDMSWGWTLTFGILALAAGVLALMNPPATLAAIMAFISTFALLSGVVLIITAFRLSALKDRLAHAARPAPSPV